LSLIYAAWDVPSLLETIMKLNRVASRHIPPKNVFCNSKHELLEPLEMMHTTVPTGFISDGVTIPPWLFFIAQSSGRILEPAILHDYLLSRLDPLSSRGGADKEFIEECARYGLRCKRRYLIYATVRVYGVIVVSLRRLKRYVFNKS